MPFMTDSKAALLIGGLSLVPDAIGILDTAVRGCGIIRLMVLAWIASRWKCLSELFLVGASAPLCELVGRTAARRSRLVW